MKIIPKTELLAPVGTPEALPTILNARPDAVYLGGKAFNMRLHQNSATNFTDADLRTARQLTAAQHVKLYITLNNLFSQAELSPLRNYLSFLHDLQPDALLIQDLSLFPILKELQISIPLHASVMLNTHNLPAIQKLESLGLRRVVASRELSLADIKYFKSQTQMEIEYFIHGDMCMAESGQCIHSGVLFGQSGNRGRCLKPCRWAYTMASDTPSYKLALKDMCLYHQIPALIQAGVSSFKIEGRMRPAPFIARIVSTYREAIDRYQNDPMGYAPDEAAYQDLYAHRVRDFTTSFAMGQTTVQDIGTDGTREPKFFSKAIPEADLQAKILADEEPIPNASGHKPALAVRTHTPATARAAIKAGADVLYIAGEAYLPDHPWKLPEIASIIQEAHCAGRKVYINTPRTTDDRTCNELAVFFEQIKNLNPDGVLVSNLGSLSLAQKAHLNFRADHSFNLFNSLAAQFLQAEGAQMATTSYELSFSQLRQLAANSPLPLEAVVHGSYEAMILDHNLPAMYLDRPEEAQTKRYNLEDEAGGKHALRIDQYGREHLYFAHDLCLLPYLEKFQGLASLRIEAQDYGAELTAKIVRAYREAIDQLTAGRSYEGMQIAQALEKESPRPLGVGAYRFRVSQDSI